MHKRRAVVSYQVIVGSKTHLKYLPTMLPHRTLIGPDPTWSSVIGAYSKKPGGWIRESRPQQGEGEQFVSERFGVLCYGALFVENNMVKLNLNKIIKSVRIIMFVLRAAWWGFGPNSCSGWCYLLTADPRSLILVWRQRPITCFSFLRLLLFTDCITLLKTINQRCDGSLQVQNQALCGPTAV